MSTPAGAGTPVEPLVGQLALLLPDFLARQRWFAGTDAGTDAAADAISVLDHEVLSEASPGLVWLLVSAGGSCYQVVVGLRPITEGEDWLEGKGRSVMGDVEVAEGVLLAYDAMIDPELVPIVFARAAPDAVTETSTRALSVEQSNTSVIVGEEAVLKLFRRLEVGSNPDVELVEALAAAGFAATPEPLGTWRREGRDLAVVRRFLPGSADGWQLALTSLRDLYDRRQPPEDCGGDFGPDAGRLGALVAQLHLALAAALGRGPGEPMAWAESLATGLADIEGHERLEEAAARYVSLAQVADPGASMRVHGDLHLGQLLRNDEGWFVLDFEGEPRVPLDERRRPSSPLRDVAGMLRSFHYAAEAALLERQEGVDDELAGLAMAWEDRAAGAFLGAYLNEPGIDALLPTDERDLHVVLGAFELAKAVYEIGYERAHRPHWLPIPEKAVTRMLD